VVHPTALLLEGDILEQKGVQNPFARIRLSDQALVITPFHQAANRIREIVRGANRYGSCGVGVGETVEDALLHPANRILAGEINNPDLLRRKLHTVRSQKREQVAELHKEYPIETAQEFKVFERDDVINTWISSVARIGELGLVVSDSVLEQWLRETNHVAFEGAQGVLLDEDAGFHPFTTWSRCTPANALNIINEMAPSSQVFQIGVMRSYMVRHGPGPLPTETDDLSTIVSEHNSPNEWQGNVRYGWFDAVLARYALEVTGGVDTLMITHMDILSRMKEWKYCVGYQEYHDPHDASITSVSPNGTVTNFHPHPSLSIELRSEFSETLSSVKPVFEARDVNEDVVIQEIERLTGQSVGMISHGSSAANVSLLNSIAL